MRKTLTIEELSVETYVTGGSAYAYDTLDAGETLPTRPLCSRYCPSGLCNTATCTVDVCC